MKLRLFVAAFFVSAWLGCQCGPSTEDPCAGVRCAGGLTCSPETGRCVDPGSGGGSGSSTTDGGTEEDAGVQGCAQSCSGTTPVCDPATNSCKTCTATAGCSGTTPICQTIANAGLGKCVVCTVNEGCAGSTPACDPTAFPNGACVQCVSGDDCPVPGSVCNLDTNTCAAPGTDAGTTSNGPPLFFDDAGMTARCFPIDAGTRSCSNECPSGYECVGGVCQLRGRSGPVQATLRWNTECDLDLYMVEPIPDGGTCEIYYGRPGSDPNAPPPPFPIPIPVPPSCSKGWLDLDANRACGSGDMMVQLSNRPVENIIYPRNSAAPRGTYTVKVNNWSSCSVNTAIPYEVEVRANGVTRWYCGTFNPSDANGGGAGAGRVVTSFSIQ